MRSFVNNYTVCKNNGPYRLLIRPDHILVDGKLLQQYLRIIYKTPERQTTPTDSQYTGFLKAANIALNVYDLDSAQHLYSACLEMFNSATNRDPFSKPLLYDRLALLEKLLHGYTDRLAQLHLLAQRSAMELKDRNDRSLVLSYILVNMLYQTPVTEANMGQLIDMHKNIQEITSQLPKSSGDRASIMARNLAFKACLITKLNLNESTTEVFDSIKELNHTLEDGLIRRCTPVSNSRTLAFLRLNLELMKKNRSGCGITNSELSRYHDMLGDRVLKEMNTLLIADWITKVYIQNHCFDEAIAFVSEALIAHAAMHKSNLYQGLEISRQKLLAKTQ